MSGDGGQGGPVQAVRWRRRRPDLPGHDGRRGDHRDGPPARPELRRDQPRGHLRPALLRDRGAAQGASRHPGLPRRPARHRRRRPRCPTNALRSPSHPATVRVVVSGAGAAGVAVARILLEAGDKDIALLDRQGVLSSTRSDLTQVKASLAPDTADPFGRRGTLADAMAGADVYIGVSGGRSPKTSWHRWPTTRSSSASPTRRTRCTPTSPTSTPGSSPPAVRTSPTRSTTSSRSPASFAAPSTSTPSRSPRA